MKHPAGYELMDCEPFDPNVVRPAHSMLMLSLNVMNVDGVIKAAETMSGKFFNHSLCQLVRYDFASFKIVMNSKQYRKTTKRMLNQTFMYQNK